MIIHNFEQYSEAWCDAKIGRISGTRFSTLVSGESTKGYKDLILDVAGEILTSELEETYTNDDMQRGLDLEPYAALEFQETTEFSVDEIGFVTPDEGDPFQNWIGISPDRLMRSSLEDDYKIGLEIKCPKRKTHLRYIRENQLPNEYEWQVQGSLFVTKLPKWYFMSYYPGLKPFIIEVLPDKEMHSLIEERLHKIIPLIQEQLESYKTYNYGE